VKLLARLLVCSCALLPAGAPGRTIVVYPNLNSIQSAIDASQARDSVLVLPGYYYERLVLKDGVAVISQVDGAAVLEAESEGSAITAIGVGGATLVRGLVVQHGGAYLGGGLYALASSPTLQKCVFNANSAVLGGGAYLRDGSKPYFSGCTFSHNQASVGGGLYLDFSAARLDSTSVTDNVASADGSAFSANNAAEAQVTHSCISRNRTGQGSTVACNESSPTFTNCTLASNTNDLPSAGTFGLRSAGTRVERCIVAFNAAPVLVCTGFSSPWIGCNDIYGNTSDAICSGDQGTNLFADPLFCDASSSNYELHANSPAATSAWGLLGAHAVSCSGIGTAVEPTTWSGFKALYRR